MTAAISLADAVLPLIRTSSRELYRWSAANRHGQSMHEGVHILAVAIEAPDALAEYDVQLPTPQETYKVAHAALASAIRVIARSDDSSGIIGDACRQLIALHPRAAALAQPPARKLADWIYKFHFDDEVDYFELDPVAYAPALGSTGLARLRDRIEQLRGELPPPRPDDRFRHGHREFVVRWFDRRFSVLDRDIEAIIRTHLGDGSRASQHEDLAKALEEIGEVDLAIEWAKRAVTYDDGYQAHHASPLWLRLLAAHRPDDLLEGVRTVFERWPSADGAARIVELSGDGELVYVQTILEQRPPELVRFYLNTLNDPAIAWQSAERIGLQDNGLWGTLAKAYFPIDPPAATAVQLRLIAEGIVKAKSTKYKPAARDLVQVRNAALASGNQDAVAIVDAAIAELREKYARRPSLLRALDAARLP